MDRQSTIQIITIKDLWGIFIRRWWILVLAALICSGGFFTFQQLTFVPQYQSTATLYILRQNGTKNNSTSDDEDFSLALKLVNDCDYLLKSHSVLDEVIETLELDSSYEDLTKAVSTSNPEDTRIIEVTVVSDSPENAKKIVDSVCKIGTKKITEAMGLKQVNLYEYGTLDTKPCNKTGAVVYLLTGLIAALLVYTAFLIMYLLDDTIQTNEDIEQYLGLTVLGDIPNTNHSGKKHYGYYSAYTAKKQTQKQTVKRKGGKK